MSIASCINFGECVPLYLFLPNKNQTWKLCHFLGVDFAMTFPKTLEYITIFEQIINWDILSAHPLPGSVIVKYQDKINWRVFLCNGHAKDVKCLYEAYDKIKNNNDLFFSVHMKRRYYNTPFILLFNEIVDWRWIAKNVKVDEEILLKFWDKFPKQYISRYQTITPKIVNEYADDINWEIVSKKNVRKVLYVARHFLNWEYVCRKKIPDYVLCEYTQFIHWDNVSKYQELSEWFIEKFMSKLNMRIVCEYQNLSYEFIKKYKDVLYFNYLEKNRHYNKSNSIKIILIDGQYLIIKPQLGKIVFN